MKLLAGRSLAAVTLALLASSGAAVADGTPAAPTPAAIEREDTPVGYRWYGRRDGEAVEIEVLARDGDVETFRSPDGCVWSHARGDRFAPSVSWSDCGSADGTQRVERGGDDFPLGLGARWHYRLDGRDEAGNAWTGVRECTVQDTLEVELPGQRREAFRVLCRDPWRFREWHVVPGENISVRSINRHRESGETAMTEYVRHTVPAP